MLKEIRPAIVLIVALTMITGLGLSAGHDRHCRRDLPVPGARQPDREGRQGRRLGADRAGVRRRQIFPRPAVGDQCAGSEGFDQDRRCALQCRELDGLESRPDQQGAGRSRQGRRRQAQEGEPVGRGPGRSGDHLGQRPRSGYLAGSGAFPGAAGRQGARPAGSSASAPWSKARSKDAPSACWASRASTCSSSISRSTR